MIIKARNATGQFASYENRYQVETDKQAGLVEKKILLSDPVIPWAITELALENVTIIHAQTQLDQNMILRTEQARPTVDVFLQLTGSSAIQRSGQPNRTYKSGQCNLIHTPAYEGELQLSGPDIATFVVQFSTAFFERILYGTSGPLERLGEAVEKGQTQLLADCHAMITPAMKACLYTILHCPYKGLIKRLFLESKLLELVALQLEQLDQAKSSRSTSLRGTEVDKLMAVREWLDANFLQPVTLLEVARLAGLNDFKLKKGFRELFHTTVFTYLAELRLNYAKHLLLNENRTVSEAADALGYSQIHHFTNAFKKRFGYLPSELRN
ncbi:helix-turn-helix transcriptional regulator [Spirosoma endophyticum]|uniref:AraC-type DNA-binding protein n=1 Tax=Spirosoma endophyticum TaxID=662367 RepID=A0A1I1GR60_9BACT|nr:AraC family transcriptional regulator [Spirosoma endophyticum]SFC13981.1 AraC-type DNA-binding protein [Spirosoma endophyticum]